MRLHPAERYEAYAAQGWWGPDMWPSLLSARVGERPDAVAVVDPANRATLTDGEPQRWTWSELGERVGRLAAVLRAQGIGPDDVVGIQLPNTVELVACYLAIARIGAIASPFPVQFREHELGTLAPLAGVKAFVTATRIGDRRNADAIVKLRAELGTPGPVLAWGEDPPADAVALVPGTAAADPRAPAADVHPNDCVTICWTSGTESVPKGVPRCHADWIAIAWASVDAPALTADDVLLNPFPMVNMAGIGGMLVPWLLTGARLVQHHPFDLPTFLGQVAAERVTYTVAPPALLMMLLANEQILERADISSLRVIGSGSAPLAPAMIAGWKQKHGIDVTNLFGSNEGVALIGDPATIPDPEARARFFPRIGAGGYAWANRAARGMGTRLCDPQTGEEIAEAGRPGELRVAGPTVFAGYLGGDGSEFDEQGYFRSGDVFEVAGEGDDLRYYRFVDRVKDLIIRGGMNISPAEIEALLAAHPKVAESAVVGYPDEVLGERTCAFVVPKPGGEAPTLDELVAFLRERRIASYKLPERLEITDALPRNPVGKVLKRELRARTLSVHPRAEGAPR